MMRESVKRVREGREWEKVRMDGGCIENEGRELREGERV